MIPKKIHYCWLSDDSMPEKLQQCIDSWKKYLPDYELVKWDLQRFPLAKNAWVREAFISRKYAFAADYIRLYALATEGGIYLDSDVEVLKSFDPLLDLPYFVCKENSPQGLEAAAIGAEKGCFWVVRCLHYYDGKHFTEPSGKHNTKVLPALLKETITENYALKYVSQPSEIIRDEKTVYVLPSDYFSPKSVANGKIYLTDNTYSIHHFAGTWVPAWKKMILKVWIPFSIKYPKVAEALKCIKNTL